MNYYNEFDPHAAAWLRELIKAGHIPAGDVDERSIEDVRPDELSGYVQCHFFAGIGGWPHALDVARWPRDRPVWTGSCPCQPFSAAGKGAGFEDERHLWPAWQHLIAQCRPPVVFGEQVASAAVGPWLDLVQADLEGMGYAFGSVASPAAGIGAPHIRDRTYWVADANDARLEGRQRAEERADECVTGAGGVAGRLADANDGGQFSLLRPWQDYSVKDVWGGHAGGSQQRVAERDEGQSGRIREPSEQSASPIHGFWRGADWLLCRDGRWRPVEPGTFPLAHGLPARVVRLRGYGNAIVPQQAAEFVKAFCEAA